MNASTSASKLINIAWNNDQFPVDPVTIARKIGMEVLETDLPGAVSGALIKEQGKDPIILLHNDDSKNRKRFSCAHELGHYMSRVESDSEDNEYDYIDLRSEASSTGINSDEIFANRFAASLLMPESKVKKLNRKTNSHVEMAMFFGVSNEAMKFRLKNLNLL